MPLFQIQAIDAGGKELSDQIEAGNEQEAMKKASARQLTVIEIKVASAKAAPQLTLLKGGGGTIRRVPTKIILSFYEQLGFLIKAGIPVFMAIKMLGENLKHPVLSEVLKSVLFDLSEGSPLSTALQKFPESFPPLHTQLVAVGERSGNLDSALAHLVELVKESQDIREKVVKASAYPIFLFVLSFSLVIGLLMFIFPKFKDIFDAFQVKLPPTTAFFMMASDVLRSHSGPIFASTVVFGFAIGYFFRADSTSEQRDKFFLTIPVVRDVFISMFVALFAKTLGSLLKSGIPLLEAMGICRDTIVGPVKQKFFDEVINRVKEGEPTSKGLESQVLMPEMARQLIVVGEKTGRLDMMMENIFHFYKKRYGEMLNKTTAILQPILMMFAAGLIALVAISLFVPLFKLSSSMKHDD